MGKIPRTGEKQQNPLKLPDPGDSRRSRPTEWVLAFEPDHEADLGLKEPARMWGI